MKKRILASALAVCMLFGSEAALPEGFLGESTVITASAAMNPTYVQLSDGNYRLKSCTGSDTSVTLASAYNGKAVTEVGNNGVGVFAPLKANKTLQQVVVPSSYTTIGASAFYNCTALGSVTLNSGLKTIGNYAFENCSSLTSITIPSTVTSIASNAFNGCTAMTSINVASGSSSYSSSDGVLYNKAQTALIAVPAKKTSINVPGTVQVIPSMAFSAGLTSVTLNEGTNTLEKWAFINCKNLTSIT
ncbi:MAG: leucine-rich repeat domain-containing protein, partial [Ruminococcus sp.]|nr:leucine-rich repeat domain-containing protein [Ruminococcus sp.]